LGNLKRGARKKKNIAGFELRAKPPASRGRIADSAGVGGIESLYVDKLAHAFAWIRRKNLGRDSGHLIAHSVMREIIIF
jgi:hypothetical protein